MKVLHLIDSGGLYGAEKMLLSLAIEQQALGLDVTILSAGEHGCGEKAIETEAARLGLKAVAWRMKPGLNLFAAWRIRDWALENKFSILHSHGYKFDILLNVIPKTNRSYKTVSTVHGYTATTLFSKLGLYRLLDRFFLRFSDGFCVVSQSLKASFLRYPNMHFIPNGIDEKDSSLHGEDDNVSCDYLISVGRLSKEKGIDLLLKAFAEVEPGAAPSSLMIVGDGPEKVSLLSLAQDLGIADSVIFKGYIEDAISLIQKARALIIPSRTEGLPLTLLEAMRSKTPVIATPVGEIPEVLNGGEAGYLTAITDWPELVKAIKQCCSASNDNKRRTEKAFEIFVNNYTTKIMEARYREFYKCICE